MNLLIIVMTLLLWMWQWLNLHKQKKKLRDSLVTHGLYSCALFMNIVYEKKWIEPDLLRPYTTLLKMVNKALGIG